MNNNIFSINRFGKLLTHDFWVKRRIYLQIFLTAFGGSLLILFTFFDILFLLVFISALLFFIPLGLGKEINHKQKGINYLMLPASMLEKYLSYLLNCVFFAVIVIIAASALSWVCADKLHSLLDMYTYNKQGNIFDVFHFAKWIMPALMFGVQAAAIHFKGNKMIKAILYAFIFFLFIIIYFACWMGYYDNNLTQVEQIQYLETNMPYQIAMRTIRNILIYATPICLWIIGYYKFKEQEV